MVSEFSPETLLEAGCGEGFVISRLNGNFKVGMDIDCKAIVWAQEHWENTTFICGDIFNLPFKDDSFDVVLSLEVLEHLGDPGAALEELKRVAKKVVIVSVPHEPFFRIGSLLRGKYVRTLGNHPEHIQQFTGRKFRNFFSSYFDEFKITGSFPWLIGIGYL